MSVGHLDVFAEMSVHVLCPSLDWIICSLGVEFDKFYTSPLSYMSFANILSHSVSCLLVSLTVSFAVQKFVILMKSQ